MSCIKDVYFWRQSIILIAEGLQGLGIGIFISFPAVLNLAILSPNSTDIDIRVTPDQASWIAASQGFSSPIGFILLPPLMQILGRRVAHITLNIFAGIGFLVFVLAENISALFIARTVQGLAICGIYISTIILGEYSHPKRRGYFITFKKCTVAVGSLICHATALCWTWRQVAFFSIFPHILAILLTLLWPESPAFLAFKGRYEDCDKSYTWLFGYSINNRKELEELIFAQKKQREENKNQENKLKKLMRNMIKRDFIISFSIVSLLTIIIDASGKYYMVAYIVQILTEITGDKSVAVYCTIGADTLTVVALFISSFVIRCLKRRTLLFTAGSISTSLMFLISLLGYLKINYNTGTGVYMLILAIILLNVFVVNVGVVPTSFAIIGEIFPLGHKGMGSITTGLIFSILYGLVMKFTPVMMEETGIQGTFGIYGLCMIVGLVILYFVLNETKDKTLQEIENEINGIKKPIFPLSDEVLLRHKTHE